MVTFANCINTLMTLPVKKGWTQNSKLNAELAKLKETM